METGMIRRTYIARHTHPGYSRKWPREKIKCTRSILCILLGLAPFSLLSDIEKLLALIKHRVYKRFFLCNWQEIYREMELKRNLSALRNVNRPK